MSNISSTTVYTNKSFAFTLSVNGGALDVDLGVRTSTGRVFFRALNEGKGYGASRGMLNAIMDLSLGMYQEIHGSWLFLKHTIAWLETQPALSSMSGHAIGGDDLRAWATLNTAYTLPIIRGHVYDVQWTGKNFQLYHIETPAPYYEGEENHDAKSQARNTIHKADGLHAIMKALIAGYNFRILATTDLQKNVLLTDKYQEFICAHNLGDEAQLVDIKSARKQYGRELGMKNRAAYIARQNADGMTERTAQYLGEDISFKAANAEEATEIPYTELVGKSFMLQYSRGSRNFYMNGLKFMGTTENVLQLALIAKGEAMIAVEVEASE